MASDFVHGLPMICNCRRQRYKGFSGVCVFFFSLGKILYPLGSIYICICISIYIYKHLGSPCRLVCWPLAPGPSPLNSRAKNGFFSPPTPTKTPSNLPNPHTPRKIEPPHPDLPRRPDLDPHSRVQTSIKLTYTIRLGPPLANNIYIIPVSFSFSICFSI